MARGDDDNYWWAVPAGPCLTPCVYCKRIHEWDKRVPCGSRAKVDRRTLIGERVKLAKGRGITDELRKGDPPSTLAEIRAADAEARRLRRERRAVERPVITPVERAANRSRLAELVEEVRDLTGTVLLPEWHIGPR